MEEGLPIGCDRTRATRRLPRFELPRRVVPLNGVAPHSLLLLKQDYIPYSFAAFAHHCLLVLVVSSIMRSRALPPAFRIAAGACCALLATTLATAAPDNAALNARDTCYSGVFLLVSRGSEEVQGQSVLEGIATAVKTAIPNSGGDEVVYPAWLSFWNSAPTGVTNAQQQLSDYYAACPSGKIVLMGYSQGSYVLATALAGGNFSGQTWEPLASDIGENSMFKVFT